MRTPEDIADESTKNIKNYLLNGGLEVLDFIHREILRSVLEAQAEMKKDFAKKELIRTACL